MSAAPFTSTQITELRHDLRTPVNLIVGYSEMLLEDTRPGDPRAAHLSAILNASRRVLDLINTALPATGEPPSMRLDELLVALEAPQRTILDAVAAIRNQSDEPTVLSDLDKIAAAAERLTTPSRTPAHSSYTPHEPLAAIAQADDIGEPVVAARILVVDDMEDNRAVLARRLARQNHRVETAENGRRALERLQQEPFDLVLLDVMMPEVDGFEVLQQMRASPALHDIPVIMISALDDLSSVVRCIESGAVDYLPKPFDPTLLRARIGAALEKKRYHDRELDYLRQVDHVITAAAAVEDGTYVTQMLGGIMVRNDELGRLARVFDSMVAGVQARVARLQAQLRELRTDVSLATGEMPISGPDDSDDLRLGPDSMFAGRYEVTNRIGRGGMGTVYRAIDKGLSEEIAIKVLRADALGGDEDVIERFKNEIRLGRRISHRNVVRTHDFGECDGRYFVTMEYVRGITVRELLRTRGRLGVASTLALVRQLVEALAVAHEAAIVHRDVKPENALLDAEGVLKVMDFGIARLAQRTSTMTQAGMVIGTPMYMAPEQLLDEEIDGRADLYATGVVLYECLTGVPPFTAASPIGLMGKVLTTMPDKPSAINRDIPPALDALVMRLLAKRASERPASASELLELLSEVG